MTTMENVRNEFKNNNPLIGSRGEFQGSDKKTVLQEFYRGADVFVTGGTGFMGKVLVEKLLRSCPGVARIFLLVRAKKGRSVEERIDDLASSSCFRPLFLHSPKLMSKLVAIGGDTSADRLGISDADRRLLSDVSVVFHLAATVRFDAPFKVAINQNVKSTREVMALCSTFNKLKAVIYVSTAYSHCPNETIKECLYDPPMSSEDAINIADSMDDNVINTMTPSLLGKWPNTYSFSKGIAEDVVRSCGQDLPAGVFRPAIVTCSMNEPMPGWSDTLVGPTGLSLGIGSGVVRILHMDADVVCNVVPCDMAINCLLATAWDVAENRSPGDIPVYNFSIPKENWHTWREGSNFLVEHALKQPTMQALWYMGVIFTKNNFLTAILRGLLHFLPALLLDMVSILSFKETRMVKMFKRIHKVDDGYLYFNTRSWEFEVKNVQGLWEKLAPSDQSMFDFNLKEIDWNTFYRKAWVGIRTFLAKETPDSIIAARARTRKLYWLHRTTQAVLVSLCAYIVWTIQSSVNQSDSMRTSWILVSSEIQ